MDNVGIFFNVEPGTLEEQSKVLVGSLRKFGGIPMEQPLHAFQPRNSGAISSETIEFYKRHNVQFTKLPLNTEYLFYPLANKILMPSFFEKQYGKGYEVLAYFDTDMLVCRKLDKLLSANKEKVKLAPVQVSKFNAVPIGQSPGPVWKIIFDHLAISFADFWSVKTLVDHKEVYHYYNGGLVIVPASMGVFSLIEKYFRQIMQSKEVTQLDPLNFFFLEQALLAATLAKHFAEEDIQELTINENFPLELTQAGVDQATIIHYQDYFFNTPAKDSPLSSELKQIVMESLSDSKKTKKTWLRAREILSFQKFKLSKILA